MTSPPGKRKGRVITLDLRYADVHYELWALGHMLGVIEPAIASLSEEDEVHTLEELRRNGWDRDDAELDLAYQDIREKRDYVLPRFMRGPFVVALWACFESAVLMVAGTLQRELGVPIALRELRGDSFPSIARRYFDALLRLPLDEDQGRYRRLLDLYKVRNALAHANGLKEGMAPESWAELEHTVSRHGIQLDKSRGMLLLTRGYVENAYNDVNACLGSLVRRAEAGSLRS